MNAMDTCLRRYDSAREGVVGALDYGEYTSRTFMGLLRPVKADLATTGGEGLKSLSSSKDEDTVRNNSTNLDKSQVGN